MRGDPRVCKKNCDKEATCKKGSEFINRNLDSLISTITCGPQNLCTREIYMGLQKDR